MTKRTTDASFGKVYVDPLITWPNAPRPFHAGSCHMFARMADVEALHALAARIGLKRAWFQYPGTHKQHYDLTPARRAAAIRVGAIEVDRREASNIWRANRGLPPHPPFVPFGERGTG